MTKSLKEEIQEINTRYIAALNQRGAPGASEFFADDVDMLPPGAPAPSGRSGPTSGHLIQAKHRPPEDLASNARLATK